MAIDDGSQAKSVLVIDDEDYVADMLAAALEGEGFVVDVAYNGRDGLIQAEAFRGQVIVVDIMMPYMSGIDLVKTIREHDHGRDIPVVLISAGARPRTQMPKVAFLPKPFDIEEFLDLVGQMVQSAER